MDPALDATTATQSSRTCRRRCARCPSTCGQASRPSRWCSAHRRGWNSGSENSRLIGCARASTVGRPARSIRFVSTYVSSSHWCCSRRTSSAREGADRDSRHRRRHHRVGRRRRGDGRHARPRGAVGHDPRRGTVRRPRRARTVLASRDGRQVPPRRLVRRARSACDRVRGRPVRRRQHRDQQRPLPPATGRSRRGMAARLPHRRVRARGARPLRGADREGTRRIPASGCAASVVGRARTGRDQARLAFGRVREGVPLRAQRARR